MNKKLINIIVAIIWIISLGYMIFYCESRINESRRLVEEVQYYDSLNTYNKLYYSSKFSTLKKQNRELYDSLKDYKDKVSYLVQFTHEKDYNTGVITAKPNIKDSTVYDTIPFIVPNVSKTYEYISEPNDTFQYKLNVNSFTEPNWYSIQAKIKNKFTIVNKEEGGANHITIKLENGGTITDPTVWKKKEKRNFFDKFSFGPSVTAGYDPINKQWGIMVGASATFDLK